MTPEERDQLQVSLSEMIGETNRSQDSIDQENERRELKEGKPARRHMPGEPPTSMVNVAIPSSVESLLEEAIETEKLPLSESMVRWMEAEVEKYNSLPEESVGMHAFCQQHGKMWKFYPEVAKHLTGFTYFPPEK
jgi:hypothetical protein